MATSGSLTRPKWLKTDWLHWLGGSLPAVTTTHAHSGATHSKAVHIVRSRSPFPATRPSDVRPYGTLWPDRVAPGKLELSWPWSRATVHTWREMGPAIRLQLQKSTKIPSNTIRIFNSAFKKDEFIELGSHIFNAKIFTPGNMVKNATMNYVKVEVSNSS